MFFGMFWYVLVCVLICVDMFSVCVGNVFGDFLVRFWYICCYVFGMFSKMCVHVFVLWLVCFWFVFTRCVICFCYALVCVQYVFDMFSVCVQYVFALFFFGMCLA